MEGCCHHSGRDIEDYRPGQTCTGRPVRPSPQRGGPHDRPRRKHPVRARRIRTRGGIAAGRGPRRQQSRQPGHRPEHGPCRRRQCGQEDPADGRHRGRAPQRRRVGRFRRSRHVLGIGRHHPAPGQGCPCGSGDYRHGVHRRRNLTGSGSACRAARPAAGHVCLLAPGRRRPAHRTPRRRHVLRNWNCSPWPVHWARA